MSLGTAGLVISSGGVQTTVPVTPAEASADAAALGSLIGVNGANVTGSGGGSGGAGAGGPVVFTGNGSRWGTGRRSLGVLGVLILMGLNLVLMGLFGLG